MQLYEFAWPYTLTYPHLRIVANPGDRLEFETPPDDHWIPVEADKPESPNTSKRKGAGV